MSHDMSQLLTDVDAFIDTLGDLDPYQKAQASLAMELAQAIGTAIAAAPVAKELRDLLASLHDQRTAQSAEPDRAEKLRLQREHDHAHWA